MFETAYARIVLWSNRSSEDYGIDVVDPQKINEVQFDNIIIAIDKEKTAEGIIYDLVKGEFQMRR